MDEIIGNVKLNLTYYTGSDLYSDGDVENELLDIVKNNPEEKYEHIIRDRKSWPILYHLSDVRKNIINWYPVKKDATVLEIGAGCGAITGALTSKFKEVTAVELSKKRSMINAYRNKACDNLEIVVGNFEDVAENLEKKYDYVTLIGVFEYAECYIEHEQAQSVFLEKINRLLNPNGKILIAIENRMGLKYFAGCREDHSGKLFEGIEGYKTRGVRTYSKKELETLLETNGFCEYQLYYPYPDYKLPNVIFSDERLPKKGELRQNIRNFDQTRFELFNESEAFDGILDAGLFPEFSNSFFIEINKR